MPARCRIVFIALLTQAAIAQPYTPASAATVLEQLPGTRDPATAELRAQRLALAKNPLDLAAATTFARAAIALGRTEQDPRYFGYAQSALAPWLDQSQPPPQARLLRAIIAQWRHDFGGALRDLDALILSDDNDSAIQARLTRATLLQVQGEPFAALRDCAALIGRTEALVSGTCIAGANSLRGRAAASLASLQSLLARAPADTPTPIVLWATTQAAEIAARLGQTDIAQQLYATALQRMRATRTHDAYLLAAYADFSLGFFAIRNVNTQRRTAQRVIELLDGLERIDNLLLRRALAEQQLAAAGDNRAAAQLAIHSQWLADRFTATRQRGEATHRREEALFELLLNHNAPRALQLAQQNWQVQREPLDARVLLAAANAAQQPRATQPIYDWMQRTAIEDVQLTALQRQLPAAAQR